jgi:hypothetical protein
VNPGRSCPLGYRYDPSVFRAAAEVRCEVLYVVGGLYGNEPALDAVIEVFEREPGARHLVFNGDFNWFDVDPRSFRRLNERVLEHDALRGNVESELAAADDDAGCGCGYPAWVDDDVVERSNAIMRRLRATAQGFPSLVQRLARLPMWRRVDVGDARIAIVHGDAESLAGWGFAQEHLREPAQRARVQGWFERAGVDVFASSHTCLPVFDAFEGAAPRRGGLVLNNGAAGMPNFRGGREGLLTRIALHPYAGRERRFGLRRGDLHVDAIAIPYDVERWERAFLAQWPPGSDAHVSYGARIRHGPHYSLADASRTGRA